MSQFIVAYSIICIPTFLVALLGIVLIVIGTRILNAKKNPPLSTNNFTRVKEEYGRLKAQVDSRMLSEAQFKARLQELMFQDGKGRWWMLGYETGQWYVNEGQSWTLSQPDLAADTQPREADAQKKEIQRARNLRLAGFILLVLAGVFATVSSAVVPGLMTSIGY